MKGTAALRKMRTSKEISNTPKPRPQLGSKGNPADQKLSVCTDCRYGIFKGTDYCWTSRGLVHTECEDKRMDEIKTTT
jgi:hypothetical protein